MNIYELLDCYLNEKNGIFSDEHSHTQKLMIKDMQVLSDMLSKVSDEYSNTAYITKQLSKS